MGGLRRDFSPSCLVAHVEEAQRRKRNGCCPSLTVGTKARNARLPQGKVISKPWFARDREIRGTSQEEREIEEDKDRALDWFTSIF